MKSETAWEKSCAVYFFCESEEKAHSKQSGWNVRFKKCSCETNYATL
jgi:hypothetical protein